MQAQRARRAQANDDFINLQSAIASSLGGAMINQSSGMANLAARAAGKRLGIALPGDATTGASSRNSSAKSGSSAATKKNSVNVTA